MLSQLAGAYGVHPNRVAQSLDQALSGLVGIFSRQREADWTAKAAAYGQQGQDLYAEMGQLTTRLTWLDQMSACLQASLTGVWSATGHTRSIFYASVSL